MNIRLLFAGRFFRFLCVVLSIVMGTSPSAAVLAQTNAAQQAVRRQVQGLGQADEPQAPQQEVVQSRDAVNRVGGDTTLLADPAAGKIDTTYISPGASAVVVLRPAQLMTSPMTDLLPREVASAAGLKYLGFDPADVDEAIAFVDMSNPSAPPAYGLTIKFNKPFRGSSIPPERRAHAQLSELNGKKYLQSQHPILPSFYGPNGRTLVVAPDAMLRQMVEAKGQGTTGPILDRVRNVPAGSDLYVAVDVATLRPLIQMGLMQARAQAPPDVQPLLDAPNFIAAAELTVNLSAPGSTSLVMHGNDEAAAQQLETLLSDASRKYQEKMRAQFAEQAASEDPVQRAFAQYAERVSGKWSEPFMPKRAGSSLTFFETDSRQDAKQQLTTVAVIGILVALLLPAVQAAREAARRNQSMNNLKQIMLAHHVHHDMKKAFPAHASYSDDGRPLLSWRVHILPLIEEQALYQQFKLDEPWDSEHNRSLIAQMPAVFQNPNLVTEPGKTNYLAVVGTDCAFNGTKDGLKMQDITDGTSKTIAIVEADADQAVEWTKPDDWEYAAENPKAGLGTLRQGGWNAALCDGSVHFISNSLDVETLKAMFTRAGGERVGDF
jgi:hypothetical protein